jgi:ABC-type transport system involved in multi-copper enzyme maturation permease subunit
MMKLIQIEWAKLKNYNTFKALLILYIVAVPLLNVGVANLSLGKIFPSLELFSFPTAYQLTCWLASFFNLIMSIIVISLTCNEFVYKTFRQNAIDGLTRQELIFGKFFLIVLLSALFAIYTCLVAAVTGLFYSDFSELLNGIEAILVYFIQTLGYFSLAFLFAILLKKPSLAVIVFVLIILFDGITIGLALTPKFFIYFPTEVFSNLTPFPFFKEVIAQAKNGGVEVRQLSTTVAVSLSLIYTAIILFLSYFIVQKRDL